MNRQQKALNLLGLAMRAGKLCLGTETVLEQTKKNKVKLLLIASDLTDNSRQKVMLVAKKAKVKVLDNFSSIELAKAIGKERKVIGLMDQGFKQALINQIK